MRLVSYKMWYLCSLPNTTCGSERRELGEFRERWEPALWVTLWADAVSLPPPAHQLRQQWREIRRDVRRDTDRRWPIVHLAQESASAQLACDGVARCRQAASQKRCRPMGSN